VKWECFRTLNDLFKAFQIVKAKLGRLAAGKALLCNYSLLIAVIFWIILL
jgi:hypothetical protein